MAEVALAGKNGSVYFEGTPIVPIAQLRQWDLTIDSGNYDASVLGDTWRHFVSGLKGWNGTMQGYYDLENDSQGQLQLYHGLVNSNILVVTFQTAQGGGAFTGNIIVTQAQVSDPVDNLISLNWTFVGTGSLNANPA